MLSDADLRAADDAARHAALDIARSFIVQAPAGSGKTELLIQRYLLLLAVVNEPEEILAITFTRKAAAEMRLRVTTALQQASQGIASEEKHKQLTSDAAHAVLARDNQQQWDLLGNPGRMRIQTLDALNASISRMRPLTMSDGAGSVVLEDYAMKKMYEQAAAATLDWLGDDGANGQATRDVLRHIDGHTGVYVAQLSRMLATRDQWLPFIGSGQIDDKKAQSLRRSFEATMTRIVTQQLTRLRAAAPVELAAEFLPLIAYAIDNLRNLGKGDKATCSFGTTPELPGTEPNAVTRWQGLADFLLTSTGGVRKRLTRNEGFPTGDNGQKATMLEILETVSTHAEFVAALAETRNLPPVVYADEQWQVLRSLFRLLPIAVGELQRLCAARGVTDHIEIALKAGAALGSAENPGDIALLLDYQVRHILVDEMQDTSSAQYRMLEALTGGWTPQDGRTLFCVGDPMQSIYRFRHAEVAQFLDASSSGIGTVELEPLVLRRNFRSGEHLVHWFNDVFPLVLPTRDDPVNGAVSYSSAVPADHLMGKGECVVHPVLGSDVRSEALIAAGAIRTLRAEYPQDSIAILVRSRTQLPALLRELRDSAIAYQAIEIDRLTDLPEIIDILALTRALAHPADRQAWLAVLRSPWIGLDWTDLHSLVRDAPVATVPELLTDTERLAQLSESARHILQSGAAEVLLQAHTDRSCSFHERVERTWFALGGPALMHDRNSVANVYHFIEALASLEVGGSLGDTGEFMQQLDAVRVSTSVPANVQVMTMHKAKGLQFDHVLLYGLGRYPAGNKPSVLSWLDWPAAGAGDSKLISPIGPRDQLEHDPLHQFIERTEAGKDRYERGRLLYVACTRARKTLHLVGHVGISADGCQALAPAANSLLKLLWPIVEPLYARASGEPSENITNEDANALRNPPLRRLASAWELPELAALPAVNSLTMAAPVETRVEYYWVGLDARLAGTIVHRWLQRLADNHTRDGMRLPDNWLHVTRRWLLGMGADSRSVAAIEARIETALSRVLQDPQGQWILSGEGVTELALTGVRRGRVEAIVIDRVRIDEQHCHWIIDYKTSSHEGGNLAGFLRAEVDRYTAQLQKYAAIYKNYRPVAVRTALYFPLLGEFVEIDATGGG